ncbi:MAG: hypothetical protein RJA07_468 [Bacteroidota bacterium]|jgi:hypothetical protein
MAHKKKKNKKVEAHRNLILDTMNGKSQPEGKLVDTTVITLRDVLVGVIGGGVLGAVVGRPSFLIGIAATGFGHYKKIPLLQLAGIGMMAANTSLEINKNGVKGVDQDVMDGIKDRLMAYKESFQEKLYLDKILKKKEPVNGMGNVQYFTYPLANNAGASNVKELDLHALDRIEEHIRQSAEDFVNKNQVSGMEGSEWMETGNY